MLCCPPQTTHGAQYTSGCSCIALVTPTKSLPSVPGARPPGLVYTSNTFISLSHLLSKAWLHNQSATAFNFLGTWAKRTLDLICFLAASTCFIILTSWGWLGLAYLSINLIINSESPNITTPFSMPISSPNY